MKQFAAQLGAKVIGVLRVFDRMLFAGTPLNLIGVRGLRLHLNVLRIPPAEWGRHLEAMTDRVVKGSLARAKELGVEVRHIDRSDIRKEEVARGGFYLREIRPSVKHIYFYEMHPVFGLMHTRLQTWFPFNLQVCMNGHDWLARAMDQAGLRIRHSLGFNSFKMYTKEASVLRVETTINETKDFRAFRRKQGDPKGKKAWRQLRQGVADIRARANISDKCNDRYVEALAAADTSSPLGKVFETVSAPRVWKGRRVRAIRPWDPKDYQLLQAVHRLEFAATGFSNADLYPIFFGDAPSTPEERRRRSAQLTRWIRLLRAHHLIKKVPNRRRYRLTKEGQATLATILSGHRVTLEQLRKGA